MLVESTEFASKQPSVEPEHERCVHNYIRCQPEAFLFMWMEIIYKVYGIASPSRRVSNNTVDAIKGIIADAIIVLSNTDKEEVPDMEVRERRIRTPEIIVAFA